MTTVTRYFTYTNTTGGLDPNPLIKGGTNVAVEILQRQITTAEVGAGTGQLSDVTENATGLLFAIFQGPPIISVVSASLLRPIAVNDNAGVTTANQITSGLNLAFYSINAGGGLQKLYVYDKSNMSDSASNPIKVRTLDYIVASVVIGYK